MSYSLNYSHFGASISSYHGYESDDPPIDSKSREETDVKQTDLWGQVDKRTHGAHDGWGMELEPHKIAQEHSRKRTFALALLPHSLWDIIQGRPKGPWVITCHIIFSFWLHAPSNSSLQNPTFLFPTASYSFPKISAKRVLILKHYLFLLNAVLTELWKLKIVCTLY